MAWAHSIFGAIFATAINSGEVIPAKKRGR
jgi:hypothetical protein